MIDWTKSKNTKHRTHISWFDIETSNEYQTTPVDRHTVLRKFKEQGKNFYQYIISKGFSFSPSSYGFTGYTEYGEMVKSTFEYDFSNFLNELGFEYNKGYYRDVMYKTFTNADGKINCDYMVCVEDKKFYIEIAGLLYDENELHNELKERKETYRLKMNKKLTYLISSNAKYLILYSKDMKNGSYKDKVKNFLKDGGG